MLTELGYIETRFDIYERQGQRVLLALVDDVEHTNHDQQNHFVANLGADTTVVTDGWLVSSNTRCQWLRLPDSWFGIYSHLPVSGPAMVDKRYSFCANRLDPIRQGIFLLLARDQLIDHGYVNFNSMLPHLINRHDDPLALIERRRAWHDNAERVNPLFLENFDREIQEIGSLLPYRNHALDHDQVYARSGFNIVIETYYSDHTVSFSEKIFHAMVTPRPWIMFAGRSAVGKLRDLGFDVYDDLVPHKDYDHLDLGPTKIKTFYNTAKRLITTNSLARYHDRFQQGSEHNIALLQTMRQSWPGHFADWLRMMLDKLNSQ